MLSCFNAILVLGSILQQKRVLVEFDRDKIVGTVIGFARGASSSCGFEQTVFP